MGGMTPRFGGLTKALAVLFLLAGAGALSAGLYTGMPGDRPILLGLAVGFLAVGAALWMAYPWAWWAGVCVSALTVAVTLVTHLPKADAIVWSVALVLFFVSAVQGRSDRTRGRQPS